MDVTDGMHFRYKTDLPVDIWYSIFIGVKEEGIAMWYLLNHFLYLNIFYLMFEILQML